MILTLGPDPLTDFAPPFAATTPDRSTDLFMNPGDTIVLDTHDTSAGFQVVLHDLTMQSLLVQVSGCLATDTDFDGVGYQPTSWPGNEQSAAGTGPDRLREPALQRDLELQPGCVRSRPTPD
jgi:hypothetical protein